MAQCQIAPKCRSLDVYPALPKLFLQYSVRDGSEVLYGSVVRAGAGLDFICSQQILSSDAQVMKLLRANL